MTGTLAGVEACVFDAYGTLLDVGSAVAREAAAVGPRADELSALWRRKQLEYSWLRSLMRRHADFWQLTQDALDHSLDALGLAAASLRERLLQAYQRLDAYPDAAGTLAALRGLGRPTAVLSNGSPAMLEQSLSAAGLAGLVDPVLSVEAVGTFKPAPEVYALGTRALGLPAARIAFFSSNGWDAHGATSFGFRAVWVNRTRQAAERLPGGPALVLPDLAAVPSLVGASP